MVSDKSPLGFIHKAISQPSEYSVSSQDFFFFFLVGCTDVELKTVGAVSYVAAWEEGEPQGL